MKRRTLSHREAILLSGMTDGGDEALALSMLGDVHREFSALTEVLGTDLGGDELPRKAMGTLLDAHERRLSASLEIFRLEHEERAAITFDLTVGQEDERPGLWKAEIYNTNEKHLDKCKTYASSKGEAIANCQALALRLLANYIQGSTETKGIIFNVISTLGDDEEELAPPAIRRPLDENVKSGFMTPAELVKHGFGEMTLQEAATLLGITEQSALQAIEGGHLKSRQMGTITMVDAVSVGVLMKGGSHDGWER